MHFERRSWWESGALLLAALLVLLWSFSTEGLGQERKPGNRWENAIRTFEESDKSSPQPRGAILFVGSSSIRRWYLPSYFPGLKVINRGFGGSHISDCVKFASRIVIPYEPKVIVFYAGDNDISAGKKPEAVLKDFQTFVRIVHDNLPDTRTIFISIKPSIRRWRLVREMRRANELIRTFVETDDRLKYLDIDTPMIGPDGKPRPELFVADDLHLSPAGYKLWTSLLLPHLKRPEKAKKGKLLVATCQFPVCADVSGNAEWIRRQMREAHEQRAEIAHFPECALSGYAGVDHKTLGDFDWKRQRDELESILTLAKELRLWVVLGSSHRLMGKHKPHNSLYVVSPEGKIVNRYDKRFCTTGDLKHYSPGDHFVTFNVNGVPCGLLICYDIRFPELYREYHRLGVKLLFHSFYNARQKEGSIHPKIMPPTAQARAATNYMFLSVNNSSAARSWESLFITPDGLIQNRLVLDQPGVMVNMVDSTSKYYDASRQFRLDCINGKWNSGEVVDDPRSRNRQSY
jgi:predicted amidohydrolase/lysophospholipase L1-like esterase